jgi:enolase-phosphatase E1
MTIHQIVLLDIEGTTTPISFVKDILFPYVEKNLDRFLDQHFDDEEVRQVVALMADEAREDLAAGELKGIVRIDPADKRTVAASVRWQMSIDRKQRGLKELQGIMWRHGYAAGELKGFVYSDVLAALTRWRDARVPVYIYSSGSVQAQKLLFGYTEQGDLLPYLAGHFDTAIGKKTEAESYRRIAEAIGSQPESILFLSDNPLEVRAAIDAGMQSKIVVRAGNAELSPDDCAKYERITTFDTVFE